MKKIPDLIMNRYCIILFAVIVYAFKFIYEYYGIAEKYFSFPSAIETISLLIYSIAILNVLAFIVTALLTKRKPESWWENLDSPQRKEKKETVLEIYIQSLMISFVVVAYGTIIYLAISGTWRSIFRIAGMVVIGSLLDSFRVRKRQQIR